jgi:seryl-tRNA synthetase
MANNTDLLNELVNTVEEIRITQRDQGKKLDDQGKKLDDQGRAIKFLREDVKSLKAGQETLELKVEAYHLEQQQANTDILTILHDMVDITAKDTDKRLTRIEKHLNLPPVK